MVWDIVPVIRFVTGFCHCNTWRSVRDLQGFSHVVELVFVVHYLGKYLLRYPRDIPTQGARLEAHCDCPGCLGSEGR